MTDRKKTKAAPATKKRSAALGWKIGFGLFFLLILFYACHPLFFKHQDIIDSASIVNSEPPAEYLQKTQTRPAPADDISPYASAEATLEELSAETLSSTSAATKSHPARTTNDAMTSADDIAYLIEALNTSEGEEFIPPEELSPAEEEQHDNQSYKLYEEDLPDNIIEDDLHTSPAGTDNNTHHSSRNIRDINIDLRHKPRYFGPQPVIAVVIDDMGVNVNRTRDIISLQAPLTSSFLTYGPKLQQQMDEARAAGHEIMAHVPMEPHKNLYTAPDGLTTGMSDEELKKNFRKMLKKFPDIKGINNHMGSKFTENTQKMSDIMEILQEHHLFFLDSKTTPKSVGKKTAAQYGVDYAHRHVFLDNDNNKAYILKQLAATERIARKNGYAVAIGHPKSQTYNALKEWLPTLQKKGIKIVHMSDIVKVLN